jgi:UDP-N-acetylmuramate dehydrogenase
LSEFSTFGIGGPIRSFCEVSSVEEMEAAFRLNLPKMIVGKGSNCLFDDRGFNGLVILNKIDFCNWSETEVTVGSGYSFSLLGVQTARKGLSGLEFASGIPATVGGAVFMNAGANGAETCNSLKSVLYFDGVTKHEYQRNELDFGYRISPFQKMNGVILSATFSLSPLPEARKSQLQIVEYRMKTQPLKEKSAGCIFRNPPNKSAGALIDLCGLKGLVVGGAKVSEIHANFIVNSLSATAQDVKELIRLVQEKVLEQTGVYLEPEVRMIDAQ